VCVCVNSLVADKEKENTVEANMNNEDR